MGGEWGNVEDPGGVLPLGGHTDCKDDDETCGGRDVGISFSVGGDLSSGLIHHTGVHLETTGGQLGTGGMLPNI